MCELLKKLKDYHKEQYTHVKRVSQLCMLIGFELGMSLKEIEDLKVIGLYHDIGKLRIPIEILSKTGELTEKEWNIIKLHSLYSISLLELEDKEIREAILYHHENLDGSGYFEKTDKELSLYQRIIHAADVYEALTAKRCYKEPWSKEEAYKYLNDKSGTMFDPMIVNLLGEVIA